MSDPSFRNKIKANCTVDPQTGCWTWNGSLSHGFPYLWIGGKKRTVRQWLMNPEGRPNMAIYDRHNCLDRCLNPEHLVCVPRKAGGMLGPDGLRPGSYTVNENGCWMWNGFITQSQQPLAVIDHRDIAVRRFLYLKQGGDPRLPLRNQCTMGETSCVNPEHIVVKNKAIKRREAIIQHGIERREKAMHADQNANRKVSVVKDDLKRMMTRDALDHLPNNLTNAWFSAIQYVSGRTNQQIGEAAGVTRQAINLRLVKLDKWLRGFHEY